MFCVCVSLSVLTITFILMILSVLFIFIVYSPAQRKRRLNTRKDLDNTLGTEKKYLSLLHFQRFDCPPRLQGLLEYYFHPWVGRRAAGKVCLCCISETVMFRKLKLGRDIR